MELLSFGQKRRSNRVVKRKKYTEDLDIKITDDEDEQEDVDVTTTAAAVASISGGTAAQLKQEIELDADGQPSMQFFVVSAGEGHFFTPPVERINMKV